METILDAFRWIGCFVAASLLFGCATGTKTVFVDEKIKAPKVIALQAARTPWVVEIEGRLRNKGFKVLRYVSQTQVTQKVSETRTEAFNEASARYVLRIEGYAPLDVMNRCFAGGYKFDFITAELIDLTNNETIMNVSANGYSENCAPLSGTIFTDIVSTVESAWE